jgi:membrane-bound lytic murein transglycosylase B
VPKITAAALQEEVGGLGAPMCAPNAVSSIGAQGLSQFLPGTWASFGIDANMNGRKDPFEPADAIVSQGNYMCFLVGQMGSNLTWTTLLWAYNAGPEATKASLPNPPTTEARDYANRILNVLLAKYVP